MDENVIIKIENCLDDLKSIECTEKNQHHKKMFKYTIYVLNRILETKKTDNGRCE